LSFNIRGAKPSATLTTLLVPATATVNLYDANDLWLESFQLEIGNGNNFVGIIATDGDLFSRAELISLSPFERVAQIRAGFDGLDFSPADVVDFLSTPEPSAFAIWSILAACVLVALRSRRRLAR
jgi:hypothetical protein